MYVPTGLFPAEIRASFTRVIIEPVTGAEHDVPNTSSNSPSIPETGSMQDERVRTMKKILTDDIVCANKFLLDNII